MLGICRGPFLLFSVTAKKERSMKNTPKKDQKDKKDVVAYRKTCQAKGTGLSHYILMDKKAK